jgi:cytochrome d ubiquinol oxidase subunit I
MDSLVTDTFTLSRIQFAANISFHILFPSINIALAWLLFYFKLRTHWSEHPVWMRVYRFWVKIFALTFALGVVSGITMSFQFGTNWPGFMETVGNVAGPLLGYEVLTAFFLEATFLGIMLFGMNRVSKLAHTIATGLVAVGTSLSAFWILALNSWMHTPTGHVMIEGVAHAENWSEIIFNPSFIYRLTHTMIASGLTVAFFVAGISAYRIRMGDQKKAPRIALKTAVVLAALLTPIQIFIGDLHGLNTFEHQPQKVAAMEGAWETKNGAPLILFGVPDEETRSNKYEISIPKVASLILTHDLNGEVKGINEFGDERPAVAPVFYGFRIMVGIGFAMLFLSWYSAFRLRGRQSSELNLSQWNLRALEWMTFSGWLATLAGWYVTEIGRQPWLVTGILTSADAVTPIAPSNVALSLSLYLSIYAVLLIAYILTIRSMARRSVQVEEYEINDSSLVKSVHDALNKSLNKTPEVN